MFMRNTWYMVGWSRDFHSGKLVPFTLLNEKIVLYRKTDGSMAALADRCSHRLAPLSQGCLEGDDVRCMYHGLKFDSGGRNIEVPFGGRPLPVLNVRSYPVEERYSGVWVWMGDPEKADASRIVNFVGIEDPAWAIAPGRMDYNANYRLVNDNLLDLSHVSFVHRDSFLGGRAYRPDTVDTARPTVTALENGVRVQRFAPSVPTMQMIKERFPKGQMCDQVQAYDFLVPGIFLMRHTMYPEGALARAKAQGLPEGTVHEEPLYDTFTCQAVTPLTDKTTCYFFAFGPWSKAPEDTQLFADLGLEAFSEDRVVVEGQQRVMESAPEQKMKLLALDGAAVLYWRIVDKLMQADQAPAEQVPV